MGKFALTPDAEEQLYDIWATIALANESAADAWFTRIMRKITLAAEHPYMGSPRPELSATVRILIEGRYIVIYEPDAQGLLVVAVVHAMREPPILTKS